MKKLLTILIFALTLVSCSKENSIFKKKGDHTAMFVGTQIENSSNNDPSLTAYVSINGSKKKLNTKYDVKSGDKLVFHDNGNYYVVLYSSSGGGTITSVASSSSTQGYIYVDNEIVKVNIGGATHLEYIVP